MKKYYRMKSILINLIKNNVFEGVRAFENLYLLDLDGEVVGKFNVCLGQVEVAESDKEDVSFIGAHLKEGLALHSIEKYESNHYILPIDDGNDVLVYLMIDIISSNQNDRQYLELLRTLLRNSIIQYRDLEKDFLKSEIQKKLCENFSDGYMTANIDGQIMYINKAGARILNQHANRLIGSFLGEAFSSTLNLLAPIEENITITEKEDCFQIENKKIAVMVTAIPLIGETDYPLGVLITFNALQNIRKRLSNLVGSSARFTFNQILHQSEKMHQLITLAKRSANNDSTILIEGESGTGKEMIAQAIHNYSKRKDEPFVTIDCSSFPRELIESELFGYVEGAFTGAKKGGRIGKFELANGGTIFLDEIGEMPLEMQVRLLRVIQSRRITRVGSNEEIPIDVRIISATNRDLEQEVEEKNFRLDLFYRLNVIQLKVPPLRERVGDLKILIQTFIQKAASRENIVAPALSKEALTLLQNYYWSGNIRELENSIERAVILCNGIIEIEHLPERLKESNGTKDFKQTEEKTGLLKTKTLKEMETTTIVQALEEARGNITLAAKYLDISRTTLYKRINDLKIVRDRKYS